MALGERFRSSGPRGISRFLGDHQSCGAGFDVRRDAAAGTGRLTVTCLGCDERIAYRAAEAEQFAAVPIEPNGLPEPGAGGSSGSDHLADASAGVPKPDAESLGPGGDESGRQGALRALVAALILAGIALVAIGLARSGGEDSPGAPAVPEETTATAEIAPPAAAGGDPQPVDGPAAAPRLTRRDFAGVFAIGVPARWRSGTRGDAYAIASPSGAAEIRVFFERGARPPGRLAPAAADFLAAQHSRARVGRPQSERVGGRRAVRVTATYAAGEEIAIVLADSGYTFLLLQRIDRRASNAAASAADAALASFKAKR